MLVERLFKAGTEFCELLSRRIEVFCRACERVAVAHERVEESEPCRFCVQKLIAEAIYDRDEFVTDADLETLRDGIHAREVVVEIRRSLGRLGIHHNPKALRFVGHRLEAVCAVVEQWNQLCSGVSENLLRDGGLVRAVLVFR